jgi:hypothetical protein
LTSGVPPPSSARYGEHFVTRAVVKVVFFTAYAIGVGVGYVALFRLCFPATHDEVGWQVLVVLVFGLMGFCLGLEVSLENADRKQWLFALLFPVVYLPWLLAGTVYLAVLLVFGLPVIMFLGYMDERRFVHRMQATGRYMIGLDLQTRLHAGQGTLIAEMGPKGPRRIWWTEEDILAKGRPISTNDELLAVWKGDPHLFNAQCYRDYVDPESGRALLTAIPGRQVRADRFANLPVVWVVPPANEAA